MKTQHTPLTPNFENILLWDSDQAPPASYGRVVLWRQYRADMDPKQFISLPEYVEEHSPHLRSKYLAFINQVSDSIHDGESVQKLLHIRPSFSYWWMTQSVMKCNYSNSAKIATAFKLMALEDWLQSKVFTNFKLKGICSFRPPAFNLKNIC